MISKTQSALDRKRLATLLILFGVYICFHMLFRWLRYPLFHEDGTYAVFGKRPPLSEICYQVYMSCLPVAFWGVFAYFLASWLAIFRNPKVITLCMFITLLIVDLDMRWQNMSQAHATLSDVQIFLTEDWRNHFGIRSADVLRFGGMAAMHAGVCVFVLLLSWPLSRTREFSWICRIGFKRFAAAVVLLVLIDGGIVVHYAEKDMENNRPSQWDRVAQSNPLRINLIDQLWKAFTDKEADLKAANRMLSALEPEAENGDTLLTSNGPDASAQSKVSPFSAEAPAHLSAPKPKKPYHVVIVAVESLNFDQVRSTTLPAWEEMARRSLVFNNHYSTGNATHFALLGLMYGSPVTFFKGDLTEGIAPSPHIDLFTRHGYRSKRITSELTAWRHLGAYLTNFTQPCFESPDDWALIPELRRELAAPGQKFVFLFYYSTHWPYRHSAKYSRFVPEVPEDFDYSSWDLRNHREDIINRYKNCLVEFDAWLQAVVRELDLENTILVITGDHGEEFFEQGRLGHASSLSEPQIRTPCLMYVPGLASQECDFLTSHADIIPSVEDALGWRKGEIEPNGQKPGFSEKPGFFTAGGCSVFQPARVRLAVAAMHNGAHPAHTWAVITEDYKTVVTGQAGETLRITGLLDRADQRVDFRSDPERWRINFEAVKRLQAAFPSP